MIKRFLLILVLIFSLQSWTKADDIRDFEIEGISLWKSATDYFNIKEIEERKKKGFVYKEKDFYDKTQEEKELLGMSMKESKKQKDERTPSEKLQDDLEPIPMPCPMHEDYDWAIMYCATG